MSQPLIPRRDVLKTLIFGATTPTVLPTNPLHGAPQVADIDPDFVSLVRTCVPQEILFLHLGQTLGAMIELSDGGLLSVSSAGRSISPDGGTTWTKTEPLRDTNGNNIPGGISHLIRLKSGGMGGFFSGQSDSKKPYELNVWFGRSDDEGKTWSRPVRIGEAYNNAVMHDAIVTSSGRIMVPVYKLLGEVARQKGRALFRDRLVRVGHHSYELFFTYCWVYYSDDEGKTWHTNEGRGIWGGGGERFVTLDYGAGGHHRCNEPVVAEVSPDHLLMLLRTPLGRLYQSWSKDNGTSWTRPEPTTLASALAPAALARIPGSGDLLVIWNQASVDEIERGLQRYRLTSAISKDGGATWTHRKNIFSQGEDNVTFVEPSPIRPYRALEHAPRLPPNDLIATYPSIDFWQDRTIICHTCYERSRLDWMAYNRNFLPYPERKNEPIEPVTGVSTHVCMGLPTSWFVV